MKTALLKTVSVFVSLALILFFVQHFIQVSHPPKQDLKYRLVYLTVNLTEEAKLEEAKAILVRAKVAGYNGVVLSDFNLSKLGLVPDKYIKNAQSFKEMADKLGLEIYPTVCGFGHSRSILIHDPNLAEGIPVNDSLFVAKDGILSLVEDPKIVLRNIGFEKSSNNRLKGWSLQDGAGIATFVDKEIRHEGESSLRLDIVPTKSRLGRRIRVMQKVRVSPFRQYHLSVWINTDGFKGAETFGHMVLGKGKRNLSRIEWTAEESQGWTEYNAIFNSLDDKEVKVYLGVWGGMGGKVWFDDARLEETSLINLVRRPSCPLMIRRENGAPYIEGQDFLEVKDDRLDKLEPYHEAPKIRLTPNSGIIDRERVRVSYVHAGAVTYGQFTVSLTEPEVFDIIERQIKSINDLLHPAGFFMSHDEIRVANWIDPRQDKTPGDLLAENVRRCIRIIRNISPDAKIFVWSDMFDPNHNARDRSYLVNGSWKGSWYGLTKDVVIANWNSGNNARRTAKWFSSLGNAQILAGYYDDSPRLIRDWLERVNGISNVKGAMYTTWHSNYSDLESFAKSAWGE